MLLTRSFGRTSTAHRPSHRLTRRVGQAQGNLPVGCELLEKREVFSLAGVTLGELPLGSFNSTGVTTYDAASDSLDINATPLAIFFTTGPRNMIATHGDIQIHAKVNGSGNLVSGVSGDDFLLRGSVDIDGNGSIGAGESGVLLTGEIYAFGHQDTGTPTDAFDFKFQVTGGLLASLFTGKDLGVSMTSEGSSFAGSFQENFGGGAKGNFGPIDAPERGKISGTKFFDITGNGLTDDDQPLDGVTVYLDANNNSMLDNGEASTITDVNGGYSFDNLAPGMYTVREVVPAGFVRTGPAIEDHYSVTLATGQTVTGLDFANAEKCTGDNICNVKYTIKREKKDCWGRTYTDTFCVTDLRGKTQQGDEVCVTFTLKGTESHVFTLVAYTAPGATFVASEAYKQKIFDVDSELFQPGTHTLCVTLPDCYYQVDFVCGEAIDKFGPAGSNIFYSPQMRLISADNGGKNACTMCDCTGSISGFVWNDKDNDGKKDSKEKGIEGVKIVLTWTENGKTKTVTRYTDAYGKYVFDGLKAGKYTIVETQPKSYDDGKDSLGSAGGDKWNDKFTNICLDKCEDATNYNFGEREKDNNCDWDRDYNNCGDFSWWKSSWKTRKHSWC